MHKRKKRKAKKFTHKTTTFPSEHSTPYQEHGLITPSSSFQFNKAPNGSFTTLSLKLNSAKPATKTLIHHFPWLLQATRKKTQIPETQKSLTFIIETPTQTQILTQKEAHHHDTNHMARFPFLVHSYSKQSISNHEHHNFDHKSLINRSRTKFTTFQRNQSLTILEEKK